jgi:hypothetical protein
MQSCKTSIAAMHQVENILLVETRAHEVPLAMKYRQFHNETGKFLLEQEICSFVAMQ